MYSGVMYRVVDNSGNTWAAVDPGWLLDRLLVKAREAGTHKEVVYGVEWLDPAVHCTTCGAYRPCTHTERKTDV